MTCDVADIDVLAATYGTPLVVYLESALRDRVHRLRGALPDSSMLAYSIKANPNPFLIDLFRRCGLMAEAASGGELTLALRAGMSPDRLLLGGPAKSEEAVRRAISAGIMAILVESMHDLLTVRSASHAVGKPVDVLVRVNPSRLSSQSALRMTGLPSPFGIDEDQLPEVIRACDEDLVRFEGLFLYAGSQHFRSPDIIANTKYLCDLASSLCRKGLPSPKTLDFGGGFGVPEDVSQSEVDTAELRRGLSAVFQECVSPLTATGLRRTVFESGRYLVSPAGLYVTRVLDVKQSFGQKFAILDGGINHLGIRQLLYRTFEPLVDVWGRQEEKRTEPTRLVGPTCTPIDVIHKECLLPALRPGDLVIIRNFGAYSISYSPIHFCGHPWPAEVLVGADRQARLVRERGRSDEACGAGYVYP